MKHYTLLLSVMFILSPSLGRVVALATIPFQPSKPTNPRHTINTRRQLIIGGLIIVTTSPLFPANAACCHNRRMTKLRDKRIVAAHQQEEEQEQRQQLILTADATFEQKRCAPVHSRRQKASGPSGKSCTATAKNCVDSEATIK
jgi:hypothetical protein